MKILHTSDWHLGKKLEDYSRLSEQKEVMQEIIDIAEKEDVDAVLIAGDLYDSPNPPTEASELFYKTLKELSLNAERPVIAIAGNHDSAERINAPDPLARECGIILSGYPGNKFSKFDLGNKGFKVINASEGFIELKLNKHDYPLRVIATAYANEYRLKTYLGEGDTQKEMREALSSFWGNISDLYLDEKGVNILVTHLYVVDENKAFPDEPDEEKSILHVGAAQPVFLTNLPDKLNYAALGHLHRKNIISDSAYPVAYSGSPLAYSLSEADQNKYVLIAECAPGEKTRIEEIKLLKGRKVYRKRFESYYECEAWLKENPDAISEITLCVDNFITTETRRKMHKLSKGIIRIIPEIRGEVENNTSLSRSDLSKDITLLFSDYYRAKNSSDVPDDILSLFNEVVNSEESS